jgi:ubiquitin-conjugating enzyme (huntingtin interacting protein 2)
MASNRVRRIAKELADIQNDTESKILAEPANGEDLSHLRASFPGPPDTPYEGGTYVVDIKIPHEYPFRPPVMYFNTKLWHPNVSSQTVCIPRKGGYVFLFTYLGRYLSRYSWLSLVTGSHDQISPPLASIPPQRTRTERPSGRRSSKHAHEESRAIPTRC